MTTMDPVIPRGDLHIHFHNHCNHAEPILPPPQIPSKLIRGSHGNLSASHSDIVFPLPKVVRVHPIKSSESIPDIGRKTKDSFTHFSYERLTRSPIEAFSQPSSPSFCLKGCSGSADMSLANFENSSVTSQQNTLPFCYKRQRESKLKPGFAGTKSAVRDFSKASLVKHSVRKNSAKVTNNSLSVDTGGYDLEFLPDPDTKFICPICILVMRHPCQTKCGHLFCHSCITQWLRASDVLQKCPSCKGTLTEDQMHRDAYMEREISNLVVKCPRHNEGCLSVVDLSHLKEHLVIDCSFKSAINRKTFCLDGVQHNKTTSFKLNENEFLEKLNKEVEEFLCKASSLPLTPPASSPSTTAIKSSASETLQNLINNAALVTAPPALSSIWQSESLTSFLTSSPQSSLSATSSPFHFSTSSSSYFSYTHVSTLPHSSLFYSLPAQPSYTISSSSFLPPSIMADDLEQEI